MKLSEKKRDEIYELVHEIITGLRIDLRLGILKDNPDKDKIDVCIAQTEIPLIQALMKILDKDYK